MHQAQRHLLNRVVAAGRELESAGFANQVFRHMSSHRSHNGSGPFGSKAESQKLKRDKTIELAAFQLLFTIFDELPREEISLVDAYQPNGLSACTSRIEFEPRELGPNAITSS